MLPIHGECGYIDTAGTFVIRKSAVQGKKSCDGEEFADGLAPWKIGNRYGFIDRSGKLVIKPRYDQASRFSEGLAAVWIGGKCGYIDRSGRMVIQLQKIRNVEDFHNGLAWVRTEDGRYGYIDKSGKFAWKPTFLYNN